MVAAAASLPLTLLPLAWPITATAQAALLSANSLLADAPLSHARTDHNAILLPDGRVLVLGGRDADGHLLADAELYDPRTRRWSAAGTLATARAQAIAVVQGDGTVLVAGGIGAVGQLASTELFDPATNSWTQAAPMSTPRARHAAAQVGWDQVTVTGGSAGGDCMNSAEAYTYWSGTWAALPAMAQARCDHALTRLSANAESGHAMAALASGGTNADGLLASTESYDYNNGSWSAQAPLAAPRSHHVAVQLNNGSLLAAGGQGASGAELASSETWSPVTHQWSTTTALSTARSGATATLLPHGQVLVLGGSSNGHALATAESFDPSSGAWSAAGALITARRGHVATLLADGEVLVTGGAQGSLASSGATAKVERIDLRQPSWSPAATSSARLQHSATLLPNDTVLVAGGGELGGLAARSDSLTYDATLDTWTPAGSLQTARYQHRATLITTDQSTGNGVVLIEGGVAADAGTLASAELYDPATRHWTTTGAMSTARAGHTATLLGNGHVFVAGGNGSSRTLSSVEQYLPGRGIWAASAAMTQARAAHTATLLVDGRVLVTGGLDADGHPGTACEIYDPNANTWSATVPMSIARFGHSATLLPDGRVMAAGGMGANGHLASTEIYNPTTNTWSSATPLATARAFHSASMLPSGRVLVAGGQGADGSLVQAERYDPGTDRWLPAVAATTPRHGHSATLLANGDVLIVGGAASGDGAAELGRAERWREDGAATGMTQAAPPHIDDIGFGEGKLYLASTGWSDAYINGTNLMPLTDGSGGNGSQSSATTFPLVLVQRQDNEQQVWLRPASGNWYDTFIETAPPDIQSFGAARVTAFVNGVASTAAATALSMVPTNVTINASLKAISAIQTVTLTARVAANSGSNPSAGRVQFFDGTTPLGEPVIPTSDGVAVLTTKLDTVAGAHSLKAVYFGDGANSAPWASNATVVTVLVPTPAPAQSPSSVALYGTPTSGEAGTSVTLTAAVSGLAPGGTVQMLLDGNAIGAPLSVGADGLAKWVTSRLPAGVHAITAAYSGDSANAPATSLPWMEELGTAASTLALSASTDSTPAGQPLSFTATVDGAFPGGAVYFTEGAAELGSATIDAYGHATLTTSSLTLGSHTVTSSYAGDANNTGSTSNSVTVNVSEAVAGNPGGSTTDANGDAPMPLWGLAALATGLAGALRRRARKPIDEGVAAILVCTGALALSAGAPQPAQAQSDSTASAQLSITPSSLVAGNPAVLSWSSSGATSCVASGAWSGLTPRQGSLTVTPTQADARYLLTCSDASGVGVTQAASAQVLPLDGRCGSAELTSLTQAPAQNLCAIGTPSAVSGNGPWAWSCAGLAGGASPSCSATKVTQQTTTTTPLIPVANVVHPEDFGASGSTQTMTCAVTAGSTQMLCNSVADFRVGQGVMLVGAGDLPHGGAYPFTPAPTVTHQSSNPGTGTHTYCYRVAVADPYHGIQAPSAPTCLTNVPMVAPEGRGHTITVQRFTQSLILNGSVPKAPARAWSYSVIQPVYLFYTSVDGGAYELMSLSNDPNRDVTVSHEDTKRPNENYGGWPNPLPNSLSAQGVMRVGNRFTKIVTMAITADGSTLVTLRDPARQTLTSVVVNHDDTESMQAAIDQVATGGGGRVQLADRTYLMQRPEFSIDPNITPDGGFTSDLLSGPAVMWWLGADILHVNTLNPSNLEIAGNTGQGGTVTTIFTGPDIGTSLLNIARPKTAISGWLAEDPDHPIAIQPAAKGDRKLKLRNPADASRLSMGDDLYLYTGSFALEPWTIPDPDHAGATKPNPGYVPMLTAAGSHYIELNVATAIDPATGVITLALPLSKKYWDDGHNVFGVSRTVEKMPRNLTLRDLRLDSYARLLTAGGAFNVVIDHIESLRTITGNVMGSGYKRGLTIRNSTWSIGSAASGWDNVNEFDKVTDMLIEGNTVTGYAPPGAEGPSGGAKFFFSEGTNNVRMINNHFKGLQISMDEADDILVANNHFEDSVVSVGDQERTLWYENSGIRSFASQHNAAIINNRITISSKYKPAWVLALGNFDGEARVQGNTVEYANPVLPAWMLLAASGIITDNTFIDTGVGAGMIYPSFVMIDTDVTPNPVVFRNNVMSGRWTYGVEFFPPYKLDVNVCIKGNTFKGQTDDNAANLIVQRAGPFKELNYDFQARCAP